MSSFLRCVLSPAADVKQRSTAMLVALAQTICLSCTCRAGYPSGSGALIVYHSVLFSKQKYTPLSTHLFSLYCTYWVSIVRPCLPYHSCLYQPCFDCHHLAPPPPIVSSKAINGSNAWWFRRWMPTGRSIGSTPCRYNLEGSLDVKRRQ